MNRMERMKRMKRAGFLSFPVNPENPVNPVMSCCGGEPMGRMGPMGLMGRMGLVVCLWVALASVTHGQTAVSRVPPRELLTSPVLQIVSDWYSTPTLAQVIGRGNNTAETPVGWATTALSAQSVAWAAITGMPAGFADGTDDGSAGGGAWGEITGTLSAQTDLWDELEGKSPLAHTHAQLHDALTLAGTPTYLTLSGQTLTRGLVNLGSDVTGTLPAAKVDAAIARDSELHAAASLSGSGGFLALDPATQAFTKGAVNLGSDVTGVLADGSIPSSIARDSELHAPVTISGTPTYLTLSGQTLTRGAVNLSGADVAGTLPYGKDPSVNTGGLHVVQSAAPNTYFFSPMSLVLYGTASNFNSQQGCVEVSASYYAAHPILVSLEGLSFKKITRLQMWMEGLASSTPVAPLYVRMAVKRQTLSASPIVEGFGPADDGALQCDAESFYGLVDLVDIDVTDCSWVFGREYWLWISIEDSRPYWTGVRIYGVGVTYSN